MVLDAALLNTQHYKVSIKSKVEQSREWSSALPYPYLKREPSGHLRRQQQQYILGRSYPSTEMQSVYFVAPVDWVSIFGFLYIYVYIYEYIYIYIYIY